MNDIVETESGVYSVLLNGESWEVRVSGTEIWVAGHSFPISVDDPRDWKRSESGALRGGRASLLAPMPGKVVRVLVAAGDEVVANQGLIVVEAMKMQNELKAPGAGLVTVINVRENDSVNAGAVLAVIEQTR